MNKYFLLTFFLGVSFFQIITAQTVERFYPFSYQNKWGVVNDKRVEVTPPQFDGLDFFRYVGSEEPRAIATVDQQKGLIDQFGQWIIVPKMDSIALPSYQNEYLHIVVKKGRFGIINTANDKATWLVKPKYANIDAFKGQEAFLAVATKTKGKGVINEVGEVVVPCKYDEVKIEYGYMNYPIIRLIKDGETTYRSYLGVEKELAVLEKEFQDEEDMFIDEEVYLESIEERPPSMAPDISFDKSENGETIVIVKVDHHKEQLVIPVGYKAGKIRFTDAFIPKIRYIEISQNDKLGMISPQGKIITPAKFDRMEWDEHHQFCTLHLGDEIGLAKYNGQQFIPAVFSSITKKYSWIFEVSHPDGYIGYTNYHGNIFLPDYVNLEEK